MDALQLCHSRAHLVKQRKRCSVNLISSQLRFSGGCRSSLLLYQSLFFSTAFCPAGADPACCCMNLSSLNVVLPGGCRSGSGRHAQRLRVYAGEPFRIGDAVQQPAAALAAAAAVAGRPARIRSGSSSRDAHRPAGLSNAQEPVGHPQPQARRCGGAGRPQQEGQPCAPGQGELLADNSCLLPWPINDGGFSFSYAEWSSKRRAVPVGHLCSDWLSRCAVA